MSTRSVMSSFRSSAVAVAVILVTAGTTTVASDPASDPQRLEPTHPLAVVESFLLARDSHDPWGAASWCAALLELQDVDGQWFIDRPTTSGWLRELTDRYIIDRLSPLAANGNTVTWTERIALRNAQYQTGWSMAMIVEVHAVVGDGKIVYLSGPYPPIPLRRPNTTDGEDASGVSASSTATIAPGMLFVGSALGLSLIALLAAGGGALVGRRGSARASAPHKKA
jgi:hypothetical protein